MRLPRAAVLVLAALLGACASLPPEIPEFADCRARYLHLDERAEELGVRDAGARRVEGFPYLRVDRFLASFRDEVADGAPFTAWVERMRRLDLEGRAVEMRNGGQRDPVRNALEWLDRCGQAWAERDLSDPERRRQLREAAVVPDDYSLTARVLGLYPVTVPFLHMGINTFNASVRKDYATPHASLRAPGPLVLWSPEAAGGVVAAEVAAWLGNTDALGIPSLSQAQWQELIATYRPHWLLETAGDYDRPGAPALAGGAPGLDTARPVTYTLATYTRFGGQVLVQLAYVVWFAERPAEGLIDSYAGPLDGIVWRVTLDADGAPLLYDTIHPCGCYHYYYTARPLARKAHGGFFQEPVLFPQEPAPAAPFAIRLASGTHYVRRLVPLDEAEAGERRTYDTAPYRDLLTLPDGRGGTRSLFGEDGLVAGTERLERFWLWPAGVASPGAMRQWGRHATSFVGRSHFDDPEMLDRLFE